MTRKKQEETSVDRRTYLVGQVLAGIHAGNRDIPELEKYCVVTADAVLMVLQESCSHAFDSGYVSDGEQLVRSCRRCGFEK